MNTLQWLNKLERKCGKFAIPNLMNIIIFGMAIVFAADLFINPSYEYNLSSLLYFDLERILAGEVWRVITFVFLPPSNSPIFILFALYFYWMIGAGLERQWGSFKFNVFYFAGVILNIVSGCITGYATNDYLNMTLFFAFAMLYPNFQILLFFFIPFLIIFKISFADVSDTSQPPYSDLTSYEDNHVNIALNVGNYLDLFRCEDEEDCNVWKIDYDFLNFESVGLNIRDSLKGFFDAISTEFHVTIYIEAFWNSVKIAAVSTLICLLIGYPMAWSIAHSSQAMRSVLLMLVILPSWTSFLIRVYAWIGLLKPNGTINNVLMWFGIIHEPLNMMHTSFAVYIGVVYAYLPFMIMPLYTAISRVDNSLIEAAEDLGAKPFTILTKILLPLTSGGMIAGSMLVFIPAVGEYIIPELLGGPYNILIGQQLWIDFSNNHDWPKAAAIAVAMLLFLLVPIIWYFKQQKNEGVSK